MSTAVNSGHNQEPTLGGSSQVGASKLSGAAPNRESHNMSRLQNLASEIASNMSGSG